MFFQRRLLLLLAMVAAVAHGSGGVLNQGHIFASGTCSILSIDNCEITGTHNPLIGGEFDFRNGIDGPLAYDPVSGRLYVSATSDIYYYTNPPNMSLVRMPVSISAGAQINAILIDPLGEWIYWSENFSLKRAPLSSPSLGTEYIAQGVGEVGLASHIALDSSGEHIYWSDLYNNRISRVRVNGTSPSVTVLFSNETTTTTTVSNPSGVAVCKDKLVFSDSGNGVIYTSSIDGSSSSTLYNGGDGVFSPYSVVCADVKGMVVYWTDTDGIYGGFLLPAYQQEEQEPPFLVVSTENNSSSSSCLIKYLSVNPNRATTCAVSTSASSASSPNNQQQERLGHHVLWFVIVCLFILEKLS